jgi:hypothetical protein
MRLPCDEGGWRGPELASGTGRKGSSKSATRPLDVARGWNDGGSVFFLAGSLVHLRREFRRSSNGAELRRGCVWRGCLSARTCELSTLARSLAGCHRCCTGVFWQELTAPGCCLKGPPPEASILDCLPNEEAAQCETSILNREPRHDLFKSYGAH